MPESQKEKALRLIEACDDRTKLRQWIENAKRRGELEVARAAELRLYDVLPSAQPGTFEHDVWRSIHALEGALTDERDHTTRLNRTRPKIKEEGEFETVRSLVLSKKSSEGFTMLIDREMSELTFEAVALRHPELFDETVLAAARKRLEAAGLPPCQ